MLQALIDRFLALGRLGGVLLILAGLGFLGLFARELQTLGVGHVHLVALGVVLVLVGILRLFLRTAEERMGALLADEPAQAFAPATAAWAREAPLPFFLCTDCRIRIETEVACPKCLSSASPMGARSEADRSLAVAALE